MKQFYSLGAREVLRKCMFEIRRWMKRTGRKSTASDRERLGWDDDNRVGRDVVGVVGGGGQ